MRWARSSPNLLLLSFVLLTLSLLQCPRSEVSHLTYPLWPCPLVSSLCWPFLHLSVSSMQCFLISLSNMVILTLQRTCTAGKTKALWRRPELKWQNSSMLTLRKSSSLLEVSSLSFFSFSKLILDRFLATESNNIAIKGVGRFYKDKRPVIVTSVLVRRSYPSFTHFLYHFKEIYFIIPERRSTSACSTRVARWRAKGPRWSTYLCKRTELSISTFSKTPWSKMRYPFPSLSTLSL